MEAANSLKHMEKDLAFGKLTKKGIKSLKDKFTSGYNIFFMWEKLLIEVDHFQTLHKDRKAAFEKQEQKVRNVVFLIF